MTSTSRSTLDTLDECADQGLYIAILGASVAFAVMLLAPDVHADACMVLAWVFMAVSALCLAGKFWIALVGAPVDIGGVGGADA